MYLQVPTASFNKLMNRLLGVPIEYQRKIFDYFTALQVQSFPYRASPWSFTLLVCQVHVCDMLASLAQPAVNILCAYKASGSRSY